MKRIVALLLLSSPVWAAEAPALRILGDVQQELTLSLGDLRAMPAKTLTASFHTMHGDQTHAWTGVALEDLLTKAGLKSESGKNAELRRAILVHGRDGYAVAVAYGEMDLKAGNKDILVGYRRDGEATQGLQLVVPGDSGAARQVHDVVEIEVK